jgi:predicted nucleotidyltransferase
MDSGYNADILLENISFESYVDRVKKIINKNTGYYRQKADAYLKKIFGKNKIAVKKVCLGGSYSKNKMTPESDVDIEIHFNGDVEEKDVWFYLVDFFFEPGIGRLDIVPIKLNQ